jgi:hypothetical protein
MPKLEELDMKETKATAEARLVQARRMRTVTVTLEVEAENQRLNNSAYTTSTSHLNP